MDSSAGPVQQRYTAGGCALDVTLQSSALSQWYPRPIAQALNFKLWLDTPPIASENGGDGQTLTLVAEGDRETLQAIAHHIAQQTRNTLSLASVSHSPTRLLPPPAPCPPSFRLQSPLSYLQLCDLTAVFNQYEQAICPLPVPLSPSVASSRPRGRLIAFPAHRRLWASSAAAALLAVGLTTALLTRTEQDAAVISDSSPADSDLANAKPSSQQSDAQSSEDLPTLESAPTEPESAAENPLRTTPPPSADRRPAPTIDSPKPSPKRPASPAITAEETLPPPPLAAAGAPPPEATPGESQGESLSETQPATPNTVNGSADVRPLPTPSTARQSAATPDAEQSQTSPSADTDLQAENSDIIAQVQNYFQAQWQTIDQKAQFPLSYQLQISRSGEVTSFMGLSDAAQEYRDRLLPADPLTFSHSADEALTLRLTLTADGLVQVTEP